MINFKKILIILIPILLFILIGSFVIDLGINSKFFIKRDFNQAFTYRVTGDCDAFINYLSSDIEKWKERCGKRCQKDAENGVRNRFLCKNID